MHSPNEVYCTSNREEDAKHFLRAGALIEGGASQGTRVWKYDADGNGTHVAGTGFPGYSGDGGPATAAMLQTAYMAIGPDGSVYLAGGNRIRRVLPNGIIETVIGDGNFGANNQPDNVPASQTRVAGPHGIAVAPDGTIFYSSAADIGGIFNVIREITPGGIVRTRVGGPSCATTTVNPEDVLDGTALCLRYPEGLALAPDGRLFFSRGLAFGSGVKQIMELSPQNNVRRIAGGGTPVDNVGDGLPGVEARVESVQYLGWVEKTGVLLFSERGRHRIRGVFPDGIVDTIGGTGQGGTTGNDGPAGSARISAPQGLSATPDGDIYFAQSGRFRRMVPALPGFDNEVITAANAGGGAINVFSHTGKHLETRDAFTGATLWSFGYDAGGRLVTMTDVNGDQVTLERDQSGVATKIVAQDGQQTLLSIVDDTLLSVENPNGESASFTYDDPESGLMTSMTTPRGHVYTFMHSGLGRLEKDTDPTLAEQNLSRDEVDDLETVTKVSPLGRISLYERLFKLSSKKRTVSTQRPDGTRTDSVYDGSERIETAFPDGSSATVSFSGDPRFSMQAPVPSTSTTELPSGLTRTVSRSRTVALADPDDPLSLTDASESVTVSGRTTTVDFDRGLLQWLHESPEGRVVVTDVDGDGRPIQITVGDLEAVDVTYDVRGRVSVLFQGQPGFERVVLFDYDPQSGYLVAVTDPEGHVTSFEHDAVGRVTLQTLDDGRQIGFAYDENGNVTAVTPPGRPAHTFAHDELDQTTEYAPPVLMQVQMPQTTYVYNADRQVEQVIRPDGTFVDPEYGPADGKLSSVGIARGAYGFAYDQATGQLDQLTDPDAGLLDYTWDGPLLEQEAYSGEAPAWTVGWSYDNSFRPMTQTLNGDPVVFGYDDDSLLTSVGTESLTHDPVTGLLTDVVMGDVTTSMTYDGFGDPDSLRYENLGGVLYEALYTRDDLGRIVEKVETTADGQVTTWGYQYDETGRLEAVYKDGQLDEEYAYDQNSNREVTTPGEEVTAVYDDQDRLLSWGDLTYTWDENGDLLSKTDTLANETTQYDYDELGNLLRVDLDDGTVIEYVIDGRNRRVGKKVDGQLVQGFAYGDQLNPVAELDAQGNVVARFVYGSRGHVPDYMVKGGNTYRIVSDHLGSVRAVVDTVTGDVVQRMEYSPWGEVLVDTSPGFQPFGFAGGLYEAATGLVRFGVRDYDAGVGRWTGKDPIRFAAGEPNIYGFGFASGDPINYLDPSGLDVAAEGIGLGISAGIQLTLFVGYGTDSSGESGLILQVGLGGATNVDAIVGAAYSNWGGGAEFADVGGLGGAITSSYGEGPACSVAATPGRPGDYTVTGGWGVGVLPVDIGAVGTFTAAISDAPLRELVDDLYWHLSPVGRDGMPRRHVAPFF